MVFGNLPKDTFSGATDWKRVICAEFAPPMETLVRVLFKVGHFVTPGTARFNAKGKKRLGRGADWTG